MCLLLAGLPSSTFRKDGSLSKFDNDVAYHSLRLFQSLLRNHAVSFEADPFAQVSHYTRQSQWMQLNMPNS